MGDNLKRAIWLTVQDGGAMMAVSVTWTNRNPNTIWNKLARKLGREPTSAEVTAEVKRILAEARR